MINASKWNTEDNEERTVVVKNARWSRQRKRAQSLPSLNNTVTGQDSQPTAPEFRVPSSRAGEVRSPDERGGI